ncbi:MAG: hypothetical protein KC414_07885, partial [Romboutsia sp.]|nr:hypothetical protein [Romboutsia sp.]
RRYILSVARNKAKFLIAQKLMDRTLYREDNLFRTIKCFKLKKDDVVSCDVVEFRRCKSVMKSVTKLPEMIYSRYGSSIISITTIDGETVFLPISIKKYTLQKKRQYAHYVPNNFYYIQDGYLYLLDTEIEAVNIVLIAASEEEVEEVSECSECNDCKSSWDYEFICSDKLLEPVIQDTLQEVISTFKAIRPDENPNLTLHQVDQTIK